jgi:hypothetical protein
VWYHAGKIICTGETYKSVVKMTFANGAALADPASLFNSSLDGNVRRAIDITEDEKIDEKALKALFRSAVELIASKAKLAAVKPAAKTKSGARPKDAAKAKPTKKTKR